MANIDPKKLMLINEFQNMAKGKTSQEILPLVMAMSQKSSSMGLNFTNEEVKQIINSMSQDMSPAEKKRIDMMINMFTMMQK